MYPNWSLCLLSFSYGSGPGLETTKVNCARVREWAIGEAVRFRFAVGKGNSLWRHKRPGGNAQYRARPEVLNAQPNCTVRALQTLTILPVFRRQGLHPAEVALLTACKISTDSSGRSVARGEAVGSIRIG